jgi:hypothetical protein
MGLQRLVVPMTQDGVHFTPMRAQVRSSGALHTPIRGQHLMYTQVHPGTANTALTMRLLDAPVAFQVPRGRQRRPIRRMSIIDR